MNESKSKSLKLSTPEPIVWWLASLQLSWAEFNSGVNSFSTGCGLVDELWSLVYLIWLELICGIHHGVNSFRLRIQRWAEGGKPKTGSHVKWWRLKGILCGMQPSYSWSKRVQVTAPLCLQPWAVWLATWRVCQNICQNICQIGRQIGPHICQIGCQSICQMECQKKNQIDCQNI